MKITYLESKHCFFEAGDKIKPLVSETLTLDILEEAYKIKVTQDKNELKISRTKKYDEDVRIINLMIATDCDSQLSIEDIYLVDFDNLENIDKNIMLKENQLCILKFNGQPYRKIEIRI